MKKVLFVCLGNICRSPSAEGIFQGLVDQANLSKEIKVDSAGTSSWHIGDPADTRMRATAKERGYDLTSRARSFGKKDFKDFDYILAMDETNYKDIVKLARSPEDEAKVELMTDYCESHTDTYVPDPYYGGADGFHYVIDLLEDATSSLLKKVKSDIDEAH
ncbi:MAG: low molecular weight phosphotyrosine protein phosphatase [Lentisphaeria bacterium]|nr:low molecular weight phosphotyrosine protein phosphatase [Lentisphaeria bacterium]NQZ67371.1 low molecular weight phosphotyrosine protein phosphatase [Lentisphaeria bacterium]